MAASLEWTCESIRPGRIVLPFRSICRVWGPASLTTVARAPTARMRSARMARESAIWNCGSTVTIFALYRIRSGGCAWAAVRRMKKVRIRVGIGLNIQFTRVGVILLLWQKSFRDELSLKPLPGRVFCHSRLALIAGFAVLTIGSRLHRSDAATEGAITGRC